MVTFSTLLQIAIVFVCIALYNCLRPLIWDDEDDENGDRRRTVMERWRDSFTADRRRALADVRDSDVDAGAAQWSCSVCGHLNNPRKSNCVLCGTECKDDAEKPDSEKKAVKRGNAKILNRLADSFSGDKLTRDSSMRFRASSMVGGRGSQAGGRSFSVAERKVMRAVATHTH